jgi:hypothetical protein
LSIRSIASLFFGQRCLPLFYPVCQKTGCQKTGIFAELKYRILPKVKLCGKNHAGLQTTHRPKIKLAVGLAYAPTRCARLKFSNDAQARAGQLLLLFPQKRWGAEICLFRLDCPN